MKKKKVKGFTLVELVICIAIIAILVSIAIPQYSKARLSALVSSHNSNVQTIKSAAIMASMNDGTDNLLEDTKAYLEGNVYPEIPKEISESQSWSITNSDNSIIVQPGLVELVDGNIVFIDDI